MIMSYLTLHLFILPEVQPMKIGDNLTYCWEQIDIGPETELGTNNNPTGPNV